MIERLRELQALATPPRPWERADVVDLPTIHFQTPPMTDERRHEIKQHDAAIDLAMEAVNALPLLLDVAEAAQAWAEATDAYWAKYADKSGRRAPPVMEGSAEAALLAAVAALPGEGE